MQSLLQGVEHEARMRRSRHAPANDAPRVGIDDEGDVDEARPGRDIGEVGEPQRIRAPALNCRLTWSNGHAVALSLIVVLTCLPRITPCKPRARISRATVQRATSWPSRFSCRQTLRTP